MMNQPSASLRYYEDEAVQAATIPYKDGTLAMTVVLPRRDDGLRSVEASLTVEKLDAWTAGARLRTVNFGLPRFRSTTEFELAKPLARLGMPNAFDPALADFSGITGDRGVSISAVVHKAFVEVEEKGTEAAAATAVIGMRTAAIAPQPVTFRADHPFLYLIRDQNSGAILFIGRLVNP